VAHSLASPARIAVVLCLPQILSTGLLAVLGRVPKSAYDFTALQVLSLAAIPAFLVAGYLGPLLLVCAGPPTVQAIGGRRQAPAGACVATLALTLGLLSCAAFFLVVVWWDLPLP
jgi:hypothetical protein